MPSIDNPLTKRRKERTWENSRGSLINITEEEERGMGMGDGEESSLLCCLSASAQKEKLFPHFLCAPPLQEKVLVTPLLGLTELCCPILTCRARFRLFLTCQCCKIVLQVAGVHLSFPCDGLSGQHALYWMQKNHEVKLSQPLGQH